MSSFLFCKYLYEGHWFSRLLLCTTLKKKSWLLYYHYYILLLLLFNRKVKKISNLSNRILSVVETEGKTVPNSLISTPGFNRLLLLLVRKDYKLGCNYLFTTNPSFRAFRDADTINLDEYDLLCATSSRPMWLSPTPTNTITLPRKFKLMINLITSNKSR